MSSDSPGSVSRWIDALKAEESFAAEQIWGRYMERLVNLARRKLAGARRRVADEEDVVVQAFEAFMRGVKQGRFLRLEDRDDLWQVLVMLVDRAAVDLYRKERAEKRRLETGESVLMAPHDSAAGGIAHQPGPDPTPEQAEAVVEKAEELFGRLSDPMLRRIALLKFEGYTNREIKDQLGISLRSVERKLDLIRSAWTRG